MESSLEEKYQKAREDLGDLEFYIKDFSNFLPLAVCAVNPLGMIIDFNKSAEKLTEYFSFEIVGEFLTTLFLEKEKIEKIEKEIENIGFFSGELTLITKKEKKIPVSVWVSSRKDKGGSYIGYFLAFSDISEIKALQENLEKKVKDRTKELQERIDELERFHDLTVGRELKMLELKKEIKRLKYAHTKRSR